jgi:hypothetical protein
MKTRGHSWRMLPMAGLFLATGLRAEPVSATSDFPAAVAVVLHIEGEPVPGLDIDVAGLRRTTLDMATAMVGASGTPLADRAATEELVRRYRVRSSTSLPPAFLASLHDSLGAGRLVAVTLLVGNGRITATARAIETGNGRLASVGIAESVVAAGEWQHALMTSLRDAMPALRDPLPPGTALLVLPATGVGLDALAIRQATASLLATATEDSKWALVDPALATGAALASGQDLTRLARSDRALLAEKFGVSWAVEAEVVSFGRDNAAAALAAPPELDDGASQSSPIGDLTMTLRILDLGTGRIRAAETVMVPGTPRTGWFGVTHAPSLLEQMRKGAGQLWPNLQRLLEEPTS